VDSPWRSDGDWLRAALHTHTTNSDGELAPRALVRHYGRAAYDVVALTDHWQRSDAPSTAALLVLAGVELNCVLPEDRDGHVLGIGIDRDPTELEGDRRDLAETAEWIVAAGGVAYLAHPYWTGARPDRTVLPSSVTGIEVFNAGCELEVGRGLSSVHWDELLEDGTLCPALVTDDSHHPGFDSDHAWTWIRADRTASSVLDALRRGRFYGSCGPVIHDVEVGEGEVVVRCTPARSVTLLCGRTSGTAVNAGRLGYRYGAEVLETTPEDWIVAARLDLPGTAPFARVEVTDPKGRRAWTNPVWPT
jgi:hypothetical protein